MIREFNTDSKEEEDILLGVWYDSCYHSHGFLDKEYFINERNAIRNEYLKNSNTWVYEQEGKIVGFICLLENKVGAIFVHPSRLKQKIGKALMDYARDLKGELELAVYKDNTLAFDFYERYGFRVTGEYICEDTGHPMLRMTYSRR